MEADVPDKNQNANILDERVTSIAASAASKKLRATLQRLRLNQTKVSDVPVHWALLDDRVQSGLAGARAVIGIPTWGCSYARTNWAGCSVCGHCASTLWSPAFDQREMIDDFLKSMSALDGARPQHVCLYTSGSFFDDKELPVETRHHILAAVQSRKWISSISLESLPQFVSESTLSEIRGILPRTRISLGLGIDSTNEFIRAICFQRHIRLSAYEAALNLCARHNIESVAYIVHKPPFLTDEESVGDTANSLRNAFGMGFARVSIEPTAIQAGTLQSELQRHGLYTPPTVWTLASSLIEFGDALSEFSDRIVFGGQVFTPLPFSSLHGCPKCISAAGALLPNLPKAVFATIPLIQDTACACSPSIIKASPLNQDTLAKRMCKTLDQLEDRTAS